MIHLIQPADDKIVLMGFSCVGKTSFANHISKIYGHVYHSFDSQYRLYDTKIDGISPKKNWQKIIKSCKDRFVLDNWSTEDVNGICLYHECPDACIMVLYDSYESILNRYRVTPGDLRMMYEKMYRNDFQSYKKIRYIFSSGMSYHETTKDEMNRLTCLGSEISLES